MYINQCVGCKQASRRNYYTTLGANAIVAVRSARDGEVAMVELYYVLRGMPGRAVCIRARGGGASRRRGVFLAVS